MFNLGKKPKYTLMVIDDEKAAADAIAVTVEDLFDVRLKIDIFHDAHKALDHLANSIVLPEVVLCDIRMPEIDGHELRERLREKSINVPFIYITGMGGEDIFEEDYVILSKPLDIHVLKHELEKHLAL